MAALSVFRCFGERRPRDLGVTTPLERVCKESSVIWWRKKSEGKHRHTTFCPRPVGRWFGFLPYSPPPSPPPACRPLDGQSPRHDKREMVNRWGDFVGSEGDGGGDRRDKSGSWDLELGFRVVRRSGPSSPATQMAVGAHRHAGASSLAVLRTKAETGSGQKLCGAAKRSTARWW